MINYTLPTSVDPIESISVINAQTNNALAVGLLFLIGTFFLLIVYKYTGSLSTSCLVTSIFLTLFSSIFFVMGVCDSIPLIYSIVILIASIIAMMIS